METFIKNLNHIAKGTNTSILIIPEIDGVVDVSGFLQKAHDLMGDDFLKILVKNGVMDFDGARNTLSLNMLNYKGCTFPYAKTETGYKNVVVIFNPKNLESQRVGYHEIAHTLQTKDGCLKVINTFNNSEKDTYNHYLEEAHADLFAAACIMKDAKDMSEFTKRRSFLYIQANEDERKGSECTECNYPSDKYYAHSDVLYEFLGAIDDYVLSQSHLKLAIDAEELILSFGKSKEEFTSFLNG